MNRTLVVGVLRAILADAVQIACVGPQPAGSLGNLASATTWITRARIVSEPEGRAQSSLARFRGGFRDGDWLSSRRRLYRAH